MPIKPNSEPDELLAFELRTRNMIETEAGAAAETGTSGAEIEALEDAVACLARAIDYHRRNTVSKSPCVNVSIDRHN